MKKVFILYSRFLALDGSDVTIGGIQTYIKMLCQIIKKLSMMPIVYQYAENDFTKVFDGITVYGISVKNNWSLKKKNKTILEKCLYQLKVDEDILIFATDTMILKNNLVRTIGIQHGISWDIKSNKVNNNVKNTLLFMLKSLNAYKTITRIRNVKSLVCVDYNFLNWYRTQTPYPEVDIRVIPNCTKTKDFVKDKTKEISIIFARRFYEYRGTRLFAAALQRILSKYNNVYATFAGSGPDEKFLTEVFYNNPRVDFICYDSNNSFNIHKDYKIAVVPTIGSEGTSLSLLEAMAAKCAVIATNVGGITNILLNGYNGLLINPEESELFNSLERLIVNDQLCSKLAENAYSTVSQGFNYDLWESKWIDTIENILQ